MENKHLRIIANPYLLKKNIDDSNNIHDIELYRWLIKKYKVTDNDISNIIELIDNYYLDKTIRELVDDYIDKIIDSI